MEVEPTTSGGSGDADADGNEESQEELVSMKKIINDLNIDQVLEEKASKLNCSSKNVKSIIREVFTSKIFKKLMFNASGKRKKKGTTTTSGGGTDDAGGSGEAGGDLVIDHDVSGPSSDDELYEPKLTRAKARELLKNELNPSDKFGTSLLTMFSSPLKKITDSEIDLLINHELAENDDDDEEYVPQEHEKTDIDQSDDDSCSLASHGTDTADNTSDFGSPRFSTPVPTRQRTRLRDELTNSLTKSSPRLAGKELFKPPLPKPLVFDKDDNDNDEPGISLRTRSKQPLTDTSIEKLEMNFIPPDISTDMYDWGGADDKDYLNFLHDFLFPTTSKNNETNDDEEADPEYNIMEDEEEHDKEELRVDRAVKVTKKELNILISELIDEVSFEEDVDYSNGGGEIKSTSQSTSTQANSSNSKKVKFQLPESSNLLQKPQDIVLASGISGNENKERQLEVWQPNSSSSTLTPLTTVQLSIPSPTSSVNSSNVLPQEYYINPLFTNTNFAILQDQLRRHIQLLTQGYVLLAPYATNFAAKELAKKSKMMIGELSNLSRGVGPLSAFNVWNLEPALKLIGHWPPCPPTRNKDYKTPLKKRILEERSYNEMEFIENDINKIRTFSVPFIKLISESPVFMYGELLPQSCNQTQLEKMFFLNSEDALIAYGLAGLKDLAVQQGAIKEKEEMSLKKKIHEIVQVLIPGRSEENIYHRIKNLSRTFEMEGKKGKKIRTQIQDSPLYKFLANGELPQPKRFTIPTREEFVSPINKLSETLDSKWVVLINIYKNYQVQTVTSKKAVRKKTILENAVERFSSAKSKKRTSTTTTNSIEDKGPSDQNSGIGIGGSKLTTVNKADLNLNLKLTRPDQSKSQEQPKPKKKRCRAKDVIMKTNLPSQNKCEISELKKDYPEMNALPLHQAGNGIPAVYALIPKHVILHQPIPPTALLAAPKFQIRPLNLSPRKKFQFVEPPKAAQIKNISPMKVPLKLSKKNSDSDIDDISKSKTDSTTTVTVINNAKKMSTSTSPTLVIGAKKTMIVPETCTMTMTKISPPRNCTITKISPPRNSPINLSKKLIYKSKSFPTMSMKPYTLLSSAESQIVHSANTSLVDDCGIFKKPLTPALPIKISLKRLRANQILDLSISTNKTQHLVENSSARTREFNKATFEMLEHFISSTRNEEEEDDEESVSEAGSDNDYGYDCSILEEEEEEEEKENPGEEEPESPVLSPKVIDYIELKDSDDEENSTSGSNPKANTSKIEKIVEKIVVNSIPIIEERERERVVLQFQSRSKAEGKESHRQSQNEATSISSSSTVSLSSSSRINNIKEIPGKGHAATGGSSTSTSSDNNNSSGASSSDNNKNNKDQKRKIAKSGGNESGSSGKRMKTTDNGDDEDDEDGDKKNNRDQEKRIPEDKWDFDDENSTRRDRDKDKEDGEIESENEEMEMDTDTSPSRLSSSPSRFSGGKRGDKKLVTSTSSSNSSKLKRSPISASGSASVPVPSSTSTNKKRPTKYKVTPMEKMIEDNDVLDEPVDNDGAEDAHVLSYIQTIQSKVDPVAYDQFYNLMKEYANNEAEQNSVELFYKVEKLFKNNPDIVKDFVGILRVEDAVEINKLMDFHESRAYIKFMGMLERWTVDCPQLKTKIIHKLKSLKEIGATERVIIDTMEPLLKENILVFEAFKALFHSIPHEFPTRSIDFEEIDIEGIEEQQQASGSTTTTSPTSEAELVKLPDEKQIPATNTCPCTCHQEIHNISFKTRSKHCQKCSLKFQDGKILAHFGRIMKPVTVEYRKSPSSSNSTSNSNSNTPS